jgi:hypothetical protein
MYIYMINVSTQPLLLIFSVFGTNKTVALEARWQAMYLQTTVHVSILGAVVLTLRDINARI